MDLKQDYLLKITTSMPTKASPGAGLVCLRPSIGSKIKTVICTPAQGDINDKHFDKNMSFVRFNASKLNIKGLSKLNKRFLGLCIKRLSKVIITIFCSSFFQPIL